MGDPTEQYYPNSIYGNHNPTLDMNNRDGHPLPSGKTTGGNSSNNNQHPAKRTTSTERPTTVIGGRTVTYTDNQGELGTLLSTTGEASDNTQRVLQLVSLPATPYLYKKKKLSLQSLGLSLLMRIKRYSLRLCPSSILFWVSRLFFGGGECT